MSIVLPGHCRRIATVTVLASWLLAFTVAAQAQLPPVRVDDDHDGIDDALEQLLAERYAPVIYIEPGESNYPVNVDWILQRGYLWYGEQGCTPDENERLPDISGTIGTQAQLLGPDGAAGAPWIHPNSWGPNHHLTHCSSDDARPLATTEPMPEGFGDDQLWWIGNASGDDFNDSDRVGSLNPADWVTYFHAYPASDGGMIIQYWHTFAFNAFEGVDRHGGDWDASIQVRLGPDLQPIGVWFSRHNNDHPGDFREWPSQSSPPQLRLFGGTHPVITIDGGGHGAYSSPADWAFCDCTTFSSVTGPVGNVVWTRDGDAFDDPTQLRKVNFAIVEQGSPPVPVPVISLSAPSGGTVWKTWTDGDVLQAGPVDNAISPNPSPHGGLINVGEYNPGSVCCRQAAGLAEGQFYPLNDQIFIKYSGRWGTTNSGIGSLQASDGPRGPVFQGFNGGIFRSWYNDASNFAADPTTSPWRVEPTTSLQVGSPSFVAANGATYVSTKTPMTLSASQTDLAAQYGAIREFYRFFPVNGVAGAFALYGGPFVVSGADGTYGVNFYSLDGLNNQEIVEAQVVSLDNTPAVATVAQPTSTQYVHSATLTLSYGVSDGNGSGVKSVTPKMDGATMLSGHGLASGQTINLLTEMLLGTHTFEVDSLDNVSNAGITSVMFSIIVTADSIKDDVRQFLATGKITVDSGNSLLRLLNAAASSRAGGNCTAAGQTYAAFVNEVSALSGKKIDATAAQIMISDAQYLIAHCP